MSEETTNLVLPYIMPSQAQKHITHNEALKRLDALVQLVIQSAATSPPVSPAEGQCHAVLASPTGAWTGKAGRIAFFADGAWVFVVPRQGWTAWFADSGHQKVWDGTAWQDLPAPAIDAVAKLGINASADTTNRLTVSAPASLFNNAGNGHQIKINKAAPGDTASLLYQTGWSGRAEMGLAGADDFEIKVSPDGSTWKSALKALGSGAVLFPNRPLVRATYGETSMTPTSGTLSGFNTLSLNQGGFSLGTAVPSGSGNRLVVPVTGFYMVTVNVSSTAAASYSVSAVQNGSTSILTIRDSDTGAQSYSQSSTALAYLNAGDWVALSHTGTAAFQFGYGKTEILMALM
ncbi:DUF2793 domain-containing protein [Rhizobium sp. KVB221]|uniref:DUF2793 domain-containing protein n=1 Tax=Rhizobium setariae TaxID=2801340 RepID=A0A937CPF5_9HYPH|nr:DUF2793 domain-containing protein [Rhizobium setariae]MBL0372443.1 DUF2793 domain-containing protein [Rhizobium setariae]